MNDNGNIRLLTPENDMRVRAFFSSLEDLSKRVEKICDSNKPSLDGERYYNDKELAVKLKVSRRSLQDYRNNGILPYIRVGGKILNIFTFSQNPCGTYNFSALIFFVVT